MPFGSVISFRTFLASLYATGFMVITLCLIRGLPYYLTPLALRPHHPDYALLRPAGSWGLIFGMIGTVLLTSLLLYSVRRRTRLFGNLLPLKIWLDVHIFMGVTGPLFIVLHTSFKFNGIVSISFWAMVAVAISGVFGRYLYLQIPRNIKGEEIRAEVLAGQEQELKQKFQQDHRIDPATIDRIMILQEEDEQSLTQMLWHDLQRPWRSRRLVRALGKELGIARPDALTLVRDSSTLAKVHRRLIRLRKIQKWFHLWHVIHRPFALIMYLVMLLHISVALMFGIHWR